MSELPEPLTSRTTTGSLAQAWEAFWFTPTDSRPLAAVRFAAGIIGMLACGTYAADLTDWFGPAGLLPAETVAAWRSPLAFSVFDACGSVASLWAAFVLLAVLGWQRRRRPPERRRPEIGALGSQPRGARPVMPR